MSNNILSFDGIVALPARARVAFGVAVADMVVAELASDPETLAVAREALDLSWQWLGGARVKADVLAHYANPDEDKSLDDIVIDYQAKSRKDSMFAALSATHVAILYAAREAYRLEGSTSMSPEIWEVSDDYLEYGVTYAKRATSRPIDAAIQRITQYLIAKYGRWATEAMGDPVKAEDLRRIIAPQGAHEPA